MSSDSNSTTGDESCCSFSFLVEGVEVGTVVDFGAEEAELELGWVELKARRRVGG